jgi:hypothetical protein
MVFLYGLLVAPSLRAQEMLPKNLSTGKIKGTRHIPYFTYKGNPYLNDEFIFGEIEFADGTKAKGIKLRYSTYRDELIYFNTAISAQIIIDKISLKGFTLADANGVKRIFRQQYYNGFLSGNRYFEVLSDGAVSLLAFRRVVLLNCPTYSNNGKTLLNMSYQEAYSYYIYDSDKKGYELIRLNRNSLLSKFDKTNQKLIKKLLRKNDVSIDDEQSFVMAWNLLKENGFKINL